MPDWTAPFTVPKMTKEEYRKMKAEYIAKYGYTITIPGFEDIIHLGIYKEVTEEEQKEWRNKNWDYFSDERIEELKYIKQRNKERFLAMLASPIPDVFRNHASLLTSLDDAQDAIATLIALGKISVNLLPRVAAKILEGPLGWTLLLNDMLNFVMSTQRLKLPSKEMKRLKDSITEGNPFSKKSQQKRIKRIRKAMPDRYDAIQALQTTDEIFGVGISLGALMALPIQIIAGNVRRFVFGEPVTVSYPIPDISHWKRLAMKFLYTGIGYYYLPPEPGDVETTDRLIATNLANQMTDLEEYADLIDNIPDIDTIEIRAPGPENLMTQELYEEEGLDFNDFIGWPGLNKEWATIGEIESVTTPKAKSALVSYCNRNKSNFMGLVGARNAVDSGMHALQNVEGADSVIYDYTAPCKGLHKIQHAGLYLPEDIPYGSWDRLMNWFRGHESQGTCPTTNEIVDYSREILNIDYLTHPPE